MIYTDSLAFVVAPQHRFAAREEVSITELGCETFIAHNVISPYREVVLREFQRHKVPLNMDDRDAHDRDHPQAGAGGIGRRVYAADVRGAGDRAGKPCCITVREMAIERKMHLLRPSRRGLSYAASAFLEVVG